MGRRSRHLANGFHREYFRERSAGPSLHLHSTSWRSLRWGIHAIILALWESPMLSAYLFIDKSDMCASRLAGRWKKGRVLSFSPLVDICVRFPSSKMLPERRVSSRGRFENSVSVFFVFYFISKDARATLFRLNLNNRSAIPSEMPVSPQARLYSLRNWELQFPLRRWIFQSKG